MANPTSIKTVYPGIFIRQHTHRQTVNMYVSYKGIVIREALKGLDATKRADLLYAHNLLAEIKRKIEIGTFNYVDYFPKGSKRKTFGYSGSLMTLGESLQNLIDESERLNQSNSSIKSYKSRAKRLSALHAIKLVDLTATMIQQTFQGYVVEGLASKYMSNILSVLRLSLDKALLDQVIRHNPLSQLKLQTLIKSQAKRKQSKAPKAPISPLNQHEIKAVLDACKFPQLRNMLTVGFFTGVRLEELIVLKWTDINFDEGTLHVQRAFCCGQHKEPKTEAGNRLIDLTSQAITAFKHQLKIQELTSHYIFHNPRTHELWDSEHSTLRRYWKEALDDAGVKYRYPYQMRHTFASHMIYSGVDHLYLAQQLGHSDLHSLYKTYGKIIEDHERKQNRRKHHALNSMSI
jgi:integrase